MTNSIKIFSSILFYFILTLNSISQTIESEPFFSVERGFYDENFSLTISSNVGGSDIYYTLDGSDPSTSLSRIINPSPVQIYINPLNTANRYLAPGVIVRACVFNSGEQISEVITHSYFFINKIRETSPDDVKPGSGWWNTNYSDYSRQFINYGLDPDVYNDPAYSSQFEDSFLSVPTLSLVTDLKNLFDVNTGIYVNPFNHGDEWERLASLELINPDGSDGFQINCGIRIRGGWSRHFDNPKHAFRVFFSSDYGPTKLNFPLFGNEGTDEFDKIDLRTSQNYSWAFYGDSRNTMLRDVFSRDTQREMVKPYTRSRYYHLYINGVYWGLFQTQERSEASYAEEYLGGEREDYDVVKVDVGEDFNLYEIEATDGNLSAYNNLWQACNEGFDDDENFLKMQGLNPDGSRNPDYDILLDVDNLIDYMLCTFYVGDFDGPISSFSGNTSPNNFYGIYNRVDQDGFKFFRHDAEHSLFNQPQGIDRTGPYPAGEQFVHFNPQWLHQKLVENDEYIVRFTDMVYEHFYNSGVLTPNSSIDRLLSRKEEIETAIIAESARWGDSKSSSPKTKLDDWQPEVNFLVYSYLPNRTNLVLEQLKSKGWYPDFNPPQFNLEAGIVPPGSELELTAEGTIYYTVDGTDPHKYPMPGGESFTLIDFSDTKKVFVPEFDIGNSWRSEIGYNETGWLSTSGLPGGIGYEQGTGYDEFISLNVAGY
ncbi:MAG: CotH kinase family protein, partial [Melioribacteraceae bacterium]|nr:CotH kinase family protein [Melioribacteraceae bacterium]